MQNYDFSLKLCEKQSDLTKKYELNGLVWTIYDKKAPEKVGI